MKVLEFPPNFSVQKNVSLAPFTHIRIGGPAQYLSIVNDQNIFIDLFRYCLFNKIPLLAIGEGTNIFFPERGRMGMTAIIQFDKLATIAGNAIVAEAGTPIRQLTAACIESGLTGLEFASGIPGTLGGAVFGNAGAYGDNIGARVRRAKILTPSGQIEWVDQDFFRFAYRRSYLKEYPAVVLQIELQLAKGDPREIAGRCQEILSIREQKLPPADTATAGSWFKNIKDEQGNATPAAFYLQAVDAKTTSVGDAAVHEKHANIFYNKGNARSTDMLELQKILQQRVRERFGVQLEREVMFLE